MITIRPLIESEIEDAMKLKIESWTEELAGKAENTLSLKEEIGYWSNWTARGMLVGDIRLLIGAFEEDLLVGIAAGSLADYEDISEYGIELNLLAVAKTHRGLGIAVQLILCIVDFYIPIGAQKIVIYNHHDAPSNSFYYRFGARILRVDMQENGVLTIDVFIADILDFKKKLEESVLHKYEIACKDNEQLY